MVKAWINWQNNQFLFNIYKKYGLVKKLAVLKVKFERFNLGMSKLGK